MSRSMRENLCREKLREMVESEKRNKYWIRRRVVQQQSKEFAENVRKRATSAKREYVRSLGQKLQSDWLKRKDEERKTLTEKYENALKEIGSAQKSAKDERIMQKFECEVSEEKKKLDDGSAQIRFNEALGKLREESELERENAASKTERRNLVKSVERGRSKYVVSQYGSPGSSPPKSSPSRKQSLNQSDEGQTSASVGTASSPGSSPPKSSPPLKRFFIPLKKSQNSSFTARSTTGSSLPKCGTPRKQFLNQSHNSQNSTSVRTASPLPEHKIIREENWEINAFESAEREQQLDVERQRSFHRQQAKRKTKQQERFQTSLREERLIRDYNQLLLELNILEQQQKNESSVCSLEDTNCKMKELERIVEDLFSLSSSHSSSYSGFSTPVASPGTVHIHTEQSTVRSISISPVIAGHYNKSDSETLTLNSVPTSFDISVVKSTVNSNSASYSGETMNRGYLSQFSPLSTSSSSYRELDLRSHVLRRNIRDTKFENSYESSSFMDFQLGSRAREMPTPVDDVKRSFQYSLNDSSSYFEMNLKGVSAFKREKLPHSDTTSYRSFNL